MAVALRTVSRLLLLGSIVGSCVGCDQVTKVIARRVLTSSAPVSYFGDTLRLTYAENPGGFMSVGADASPWLRSWTFGGLTALMVVVLVVAAVRSRSPGRAHVIALALVIAGGIGNLIDRAAYGAVRDFLNVGVGELRTGIFNVADMAVMTGVLRLCLGSLRHGNDAPEDEGCGRPDETAERAS